MMNLFRRRPEDCAQPEHEFKLRVEIEREADGRWLADIIDLPGVMAYGLTEQEALSKAAALALRVLADRLEHGEKVVPHAPMSFSLVPA